MKEVLFWLAIQHRGGSM